VHFGAEPPERLDLLLRSEITTGSKPNRNPARAEVMDQGKSRLFMRCLYPKRPPVGNEPG